MTERRQELQETKEHELRVILFGMRCAFTGPILATLASTPGLDLAAVVLPGGITASRRQTPDPVSTLVSSHQLPLIEIRDRNEFASTGFRAALQAFAPDVLAVACFPWRLPRSILTVPRHGCINVHPSLLPDGHGPEPLFWAFRWRLTETGVTLHVIDGGFDTGPILAQRTQDITEDDTMITLERSLAHLGAAMLVEELSSLQTPMPQDSTSGRYARFPRASDLVVPTSWPARVASRFIRAVRPVYGTVPVLIRATGQQLVVNEVMGFGEDAVIKEPMSLEGDIATIQFSDGTLTCRINVSNQPLRIYTREN